MSQQPILRGRRYISQSEKVRIVGESQTSGLSTAEVARINKVGLSSLIKWRKQYSEGGSVSVKSDDDVISKKEYLKLKKQYRNLETVLSRKSAEKENSLLHLPFGKRAVRAHEGKIITLYSNLRGCSAFTIPCDNGDRVQVAFALDCCDREAMGYIATS